MFWADKIAKSIISSGKYTPYWVDDMKTPSGRIHVGSLRGVVIHDLVHRALKDAGKDVTFTYVFEDHDPMDALPAYLEKNKWEQYLGQPLFTVPSPEPKSASNYAEYFALEFKDVFNKIGSHPKITWTGNLYKTGRMNDGIKKCLERVDIIRDIYETTYKKNLPENWYPFQVVCPKCQKESTTKVTAWDGQEVSFVCHVKAVDWTRGCGFAGKTTPFSGEGKYVGKLPWKIEWAVKWMVIGVTVEGAGKDHMSAGGSHDISKLVCERVLNYPVPYPVAYEFFLIGGKKMSSSKGLGSSAKEVSEVLPPNLLRFLFSRTNYNEAIDFNPVNNMYVPDLYDEYDRCWQAYAMSSDADLARAFELAQVGEPPKRVSVFIPRFRDVVNYVQLPDVDLIKKFSEVKGIPLTPGELEILKERVQYAHLWLDKYAPSEYKFHMTDKLPEEATQFTDEQRQYLAQTVILLKEHDDPEKLQLALYESAKEINLPAKAAFSALYTSLIGKTHGPRAAWFLMQYPKEQVIKRLEEAISITQPQSGTQYRVKAIHKPEYFAIDLKVKQKLPSVSIGIALIKGISVKQRNPWLEIEKEQLLSRLSGLTTSKISQFPEVLSYRRLYKEMGVDWHSKRPTTEALLRRIALGKGLYAINTCVDAYNLVVIKNRVSLGAFDADAIKFPTHLRFPKTGDEILLLGDSVPTQYTGKELAYYDQIGGYNINFNYRDAQRTMVTEATENIWINVDGVYDITPEQVAASLEEASAMIQKFCGGKVEFQGIVI